MKTLNADGQEMIDGRAVTLYEGKIINAFLMDDTDAIGLSDGDVVSLTVTVRVETPKFTTVKKSGNLKRQNQFRVIDYTVKDLDEVEAEEDEIDLGELEIA